MGDLIPKTLENLFSGHAFPYHAAEQELGTSRQLAKDAFYTHAFAALRSVLELNALGV
jgi:hypothetical protein